jgi:hypothetical protein
MFKQAAIGKSFNAKGDNGEEVRGTRRRSRLDTAQISSKFWRRQS